MPSTQIAFGSISNDSRNGDAIPLLQSDSLTYATTLTPSGTSQQAAVAAPAGAASPVNPAQIDPRTALITSMAVSLGISSEEIDNLFVAAAAIG